MAGVSLVLFIGVAVSSVRVARRHLSYETWHGLHLYAYLAIALGLGHQLVTGSDFAHDPDRLGLLGEPVPHRCRLDPRLPVRRAACCLGPPSVPGGECRARGSRRHLDLPWRAGPGRVRDPGRPVRHRPVPGSGRLVARPPVLDLGGAERALVAPDGQGPRRRHDVDGVPGHRYPGVPRRAVRPADRRPAPPPAGPADRRRDRHRAAAGAVRGAAGRTGRPDPRLPREPAHGHRLSRRARIISPMPAERSSTT